MTEDILLKNYTTFKCGGPAKFFDEPASEEDIINDLKFASANRLDVFVLGGGANCLISDKGFDGLVIRIGKELSSFNIEENGDHAVVTAGAGMLLRSFGTKIADAGYGGTEFACGIPGTLGGGVFMNAGAYGGEMKDIVTKVRFVDEDGIHEAAGEDLLFGYRTSVFARMAKAGKIFVITQVTAEVSKGDPAEIKSRIEEYKEKRTSSQPLDVPSAGSTFKRPEGYFAGKLIDDAGLRGYSREGSSAQVSPKHCGFVVNNGGKASAQEIYDLIMDVSGKVFEKFEIRLEPEVRLIGDFGQGRSIEISSFGFKYGVPEDADLILDARSLKNPYWVPELKPLSGLDEPIKKYLSGFEETGRLVTGFRDEVLAASAQKKGETFKVAVGCTGGHHRSVYCAESLAKILKDLGYNTTVTHRDILNESCDV
ncbi:MAG: UDP-N-acetylmuramate dehydrogenase [Clostridiales bacterium]|nr:UDP-N-acetylmuramate dehydrogenase [Clostridiales bacterium]